MFARKTNFLALKRLASGGLALLLVGCSLDSGSEGDVPGSFLLGGSITGLDVPGLVLTNGTDTLSVDSGATEFTMPAGVPAGQRFELRVQAQPVGLTCSAASASGVMPAADMRNAVITCSRNAHRLGGSVSGLSSSGLVLANGGDAVAVAAGTSSFNLPSSVARGSSYVVVVRSQPQGQSCSVRNGSGMMGEADVGSIAVICNDRPFSVGGSISGLASTGLVLANGSDMLAVPAGSSSFTLPEPVSFGASYAVSVQMQPAGLTCSVAHGAGTMGADDVENVVATCSANSYQVGGTITGLAQAGLVLANGADTFAVPPGSTSFTMGARVAFGGGYAVTVQAQPTGLTCSVSSGTGTMGADNVSGVVVTCSTNSYTLGGSISGLADTGLVLANGSDTLSVSANALSFTMGQPVAHGATYDVEVAVQPNWLACSVADGAGTMGVAAVSDVAVSCALSVHVSTLAGSGSAGSVNATGTAAQFDSPTSVAVDRHGNVYVADQYNHLIRRITPGGVVTTLAGSGVQGSADGNGTQAEFGYPFGIAIDGGGNLYVSDESNDLIRKITPAGDVSTFAGSGFNGSADGDALTAEFSSPQGVAVDAAGNVYVADSGNHAIRKITPSGQVTTLAGSGSPGNADGHGTAASFNRPSGIAVDAAGNLYVTDLFNHKVRKLSPSGTVTTFAGSGTPGTADGSGTAASFVMPSGIAIDVTSGLYVSEYAGRKVRRVDPSGTVTTWAGTGIAGSVDGTAATATFAGPIGLAVSASGGTLFVADYGGNTIRRISNAP